MKKIRLGILFGGRSQEHEVSLQSAKNIYEALDKKKYEISLIGIDRNGKFHGLPTIKSLSQTQIPDENNSPAVILNSFQDLVSNKIPTDLHSVISSEARNLSLDVVFPVLHGPFGEDGTVQGLLKLADIPFVGASVLGSAIGMDKDVMKRLLRDGGISIAKFIVLHKNVMLSETKHLKDSSSSTQNDNVLSFEIIQKQLGLPFFVKPANTGSSVGVSRVTNKKEFDKAIKNAFQFDNKILIEEAIIGRELECAVLGNEEPIASTVGEVIPSHEFYDYEAKYIDENGAKLIIPAKITNQQLKQIQILAVDAFKVLCCEGMARVDFFLSEGGQIYVNEINTIPGFTNISMYPKLWESIGIPYSDLIDRLITLAIERHKRDAKLL